jgi:hypothetical protein
MIKESIPDLSEEEVTKLSDLLGKFLIDYVNKIFDSAQQDEYREIFSKNPDVLVNFILKVSAGLTFESMKILMHMTNIKLEDCRDIFNKLLEHRIDFEKRYEEENKDEQIKH